MLLFKIITKLIPIVVKPIMFYFLFLTNVFKITVLVCSLFIVTAFILIPVMVDYKNKAFQPVQLLKQTLLYQAPSYNHPNYNTNSLTSSICFNTNPEYLLIYAFSGLQSSASLLGLSPSNGRSDLRPTDNSNLCAVMTRNPGNKSLVSYVH